MELTPIKKSMLYTKGGDKGLTSLYDGTRVPKNDKLFYILGEIDTLNVYLGSAYSECESEYKDLPEDEKRYILSLLKYTIHSMMDISSELATPNPEKRKKVDLLEEKDLAYIETMINYYDHNCPKLKNFVHPIGYGSVKYFHMARTQTRHVERLLKSYADEHDSEDDIRQVRVLLRKYFNRFSDFCYALARYHSNKFYCEVIKPAKRSRPELTTEQCQHFMVKGSRFS